MEIWRLIEDIPRSGSFNMAADQMLLDNFSQDDNPVFRIYDWECPTLSLGRHEVLDSRIDLKACESQEIPIVRRTTGGKAVLHGFDLTYSLVGSVMDKQFPGGVLDNYRYLSKGFSRFFQRLGLNPDIQERISRKKNKDPHICFVDPSAYEILVEGRKIIGSAQRVRTIHKPDAMSNRVFLQHGSIPLNDSIVQIAKIFPYVHEDSLRHEMHSLESVGIYPGHSIDELRQVLLESLQETFQLEWNHCDWSVDELSLIKDCETAFQPL